HRRLRKEQDAEHEQALMRGEAISRRLGFIQEGSGRSYSIGPSSSTHVGAGEGLEIPAPGTTIADHRQQFLPARSDSGQPLHFDGTPKPRLGSTAFEVDGHALFHWNVALGT